MKSIVLDNLDGTCDFLLDGNYDLVIVTYQFLATQFRKYHTFNPWAKGGSKLLSLGMFSPLYNMLGLPIKHLVIDEANYGQDIHGLSHQTFRALYRSCTILLTGTPFRNRWCSIYPLMYLLPGHPFKNDITFQHVFGKISS